ncbi:hypothetical protein Tco_0147991 [Tanacetum coccineum]
MAVSLGIVPPPYFENDLSLILLNMIQNKLDGMQLPDTVRWRIQTAMPFVFPSVKLSISCQPPNVPASALGFLQPSILIPRPHHVSLRNNQVSLSSNISNGPSKATKPLSSQLDYDIEIDPWTILEDGAGSPSNSYTLPKTLKVLELINTPTSFS